MTTYLRTDEYLPHAPKNAGTIHINHAHCPAGEDRKKRLYITRKQDGTVVAYCHHCTRTGSTRSPAHLGGGSRNLLGAVCAVEDEKDSGRGEKGRGPRPVTFPSFASFDPEAWPKEVRDWYQGFGITNEEARSYGFHYVNNGYLAGRLGLPCFSDGVLNGIQFRKVLSPDGPKYLSRFKDEAAPGTARTVCGTSDEASVDRKYFDSTQHKPASGCAASAGHPVLRNGCVVVVEDVLSAIKVGRQCRAIACLTTTAPESIMLALVEQGYHTVYVWLDNDNVDVNRKARAIERHLGMVFPTVVYVSDKQDPKHYTDEEIREVLDGCK